MAPTDTSALAMTLPTNIAVFLIGFGNRKHPVFDSYSETIASALKKVALSTERIGTAMEAETALSVPRNQSMFSVNCVRSLGYCEPTAGVTTRKIATLVMDSICYRSAVVFVKKRAATA